MMFLYYKNEDYINIVHFNQNEQYWLLYQQVKLIQNPCVVCVPSFQDTIIYKLLIVQQRLCSCVNTNHGWSCLYLLLGKLEKQLNKWDITSLALIIDTQNKPTLYEVTMSTHVISRNYPHCRSGFSKYNFFFGSWQQV